MHVEYIMMHIYDSSMLYIETLLFGTEASKSPKQDQEITRFKPAAPSTGL